MDGLCFPIVDYHKQITSGKTTLAALAQTESDCSSAKNGGDLGFFGPGQMQSMLKCYFMLSVVGFLPMIFKKKTTKYL